MIVTSLSPERKRLLVNKEHLTENRRTMKEEMKEEKREEKKEEMTTEEMTDLLVKITDATIEEKIVLLVMNTEEKTVKTEVKEDLTLHVVKEGNSMVMMTEKKEDLLKEKTIVLVDQDEEALERDSTEKEENQENKSQENQSHSQLNLHTLLSLETFHSLLLLTTCTNSSLLRTARLPTSESLPEMMENSRAMDTWNLKIWIPSRLPLV
mmetsp:Transcript_16762/g.23316  ORF Transcript_16762/g.23316 Transcript_16762/m.23316 type:complete len:209 (+) Transcript_16762:364-990(+)